MNTIADVAFHIQNNDNFIIIPHRSPDGDCLGSSSALLLALRAMGKHVAIRLPSAIPARLEFLWNEEYERVDFVPEVAVSVDVAADYMMLGLYDEVYMKAKSRICIDHHGTNDGFGDINYVDASSSAAGEIVYKLITELGVSLTSDIAEKLYISIADDTGGFQYSNTTARTHRIVAELYDCGINSDDIMRRLFATHALTEMELLKFITNRMEYHLDGKVCTTYVDDEALEASGAQLAQADAWIGFTRSVEGVEVGIMLKAIAPEETRVSLRSNSYVDVSAVARKFGGGGHVRAAGVTFNENLISAKNKLLSELEKLV